jgi:S1-C subfamily serine protease
MSSTIDPGTDEAVGGPSWVDPHAGRRPPSAPGTTARARRFAPYAVAALLGGLVAGIVVAAVGDHDGGRGGASATSAAAAAVPASAAAPAAPAPTAGAETIPQIYRAASPGVVQINQGGAEGSGFVLDRQGDIVTNAHVVTNGGPVSVSFSNNDRVPARLVGYDNTTDVALLHVKVPAAALVPLPLGDSATLQVGDGVVAIGNPFGLDRSASAGIVSALNRQITSPNGFAINGAIQTDAAINHGNSGGPLLDMHGQVIGIDSQIADSGVDANVGVGFAVPIDTVKQIVTGLARHGSISHAFLGVSLSPVDQTLASQVKVPVSSGAMIAGIDPSGPAASSSLQAATGTIVLDGTTYSIGGDIVTGVNGTRVTSPEDLQTAIGALRAGDRVALQVVRPDGTRATVTLTAGRQPTTSPAAQELQP